MRTKAAWWLGLGLVCVAFPACRGGGGSDDDAQTGTGDDGGDGEVAPDDGVGRMGMRRLSRRELEATLYELVGDDTRPGDLLPQDPLTPFDNDFNKQTPSQVLIDAVEIIARDVAQRLTSDPVRRDAVVGCTPSDVADATCMTQFVTGFGRRALRRPLSDDEVSDYVALGIDFAIADADFYTGVEVVVRTLLQDLEFLYRVERGTAVADRPGVFRLDDFEIGTRMAYLVWGTTPDDWLLDTAQAGNLSTSEDRIAAAQAMLEDPRARDQIDLFHAMWLGYNELPHPQDLTTGLRTETAALVTRVIFDDRSSWTDLFTSTQTWVDAGLAAHYGLPAPEGGGWGWVSYGDTGRQGLLSHGSFLSVAANGMDTSPTKRGKLIRNRLMCEEIPPPPPNVDADEPPDTSAADCKWDQYAAHREKASCAGCHEYMDPIGFGLENYDGQGKYREHDDGFVECTIAGEGSLPGLGTFNGPAGLADLLVEAGRLDDCVVVNLYRFAMGHEPLADDVAFVDEVGVGFEDSGRLFDQLLLDVVGHTAFAFRMEE